MAAKQTIRVSGPRTASGQDGPIQIHALVDPDDGGPTEVALYIDQTAAAGTTPTVDLAVEWAMSSAGPFTAAATPETFPQLTDAAGGLATHVLRLPIQGTHLRLDAVFAGSVTPSITYSAEALPL